MKKSIIAILVLIIILFAFMHYSKGPVQNSTVINNTNTTNPINTITYSCDAGKSLVVSISAGTTIPSSDPNSPPIPGGSAKVSLSDGRTLNLNQTISADGIRYANADESFVFWSKGHGALILENNVEKSYIGCIEVTSVPSGSDLTRVYSNSSEGFSISIPTNYTVNESFVDELSPTKRIKGIKFQIASSTASGTNLGNDTYLSVETIPQTNSCTADLFLADSSGKAQTLTDGDTTYSVASSTGAGAGNRYEETVYAIPGTNPCIAVHYFVHYSVFENYPAGTVSEFNRQNLLNQFDSIRHTLIHM
jgi:membrane-bound inhibitor of C-type lysozyme